MELMAGARGWFVACALGIGASVVSAVRGEPTESAVDMWATVRGAASGAMEGEHKSITGFVTGVASVGSAGRGEPMGSSVGMWASVLEAASRGVEGRHKSMAGLRPVGLWLLMGSPERERVVLGAGSQSCCCSWCTMGE